MVGLVDARFVADKKGVTAKVDQYAMINPGSLEIVDQLDVVDGCGFTDCFQFDYYLFVNQNINAETSNQLVLVMNVYRNFGFSREADIL